MPKKDFVVKITVAQAKISKVELGVTSAYPDLSKQYTLKYNKNFFGENKLDVSVTENGLLTSTKSDTISKVNEAFKALASSV
ncbi:hypothetical protein A1342_00045 [Methylomonas methanica]|uniref:Uncharacterized protein n=2 Tax=Methylococcaceae TaxID=403 RepID=A0A140E5Z1_9GAMM|nr:hypothetical protein JT25_020370 [Methylomonas denitrificans]OAI02266.1 hypothetical protein A1342_00045 [Methylomonas methanica]